ncbi:unnamed protein product, partial [Mesorhabditis spiculigera]
MLATSANVEQQIDGTRIFEYCRHLERHEMRRLDVEELRDIGSIDTRGPFWSSSGIAKMVPSRTTNYVPTNYPEDANGLARLVADSIHQFEQQMVIDAPHREQILASREYKEKLESEVGPWRVLYWRGGGWKGMTSLGLERFHPCSTVKIPHGSVGVLTHVRLRANHSWAKVERHMLENVRAANYVDESQMRDFHAQQQHFSAFPALSTAMAAAGPSTSGSNNGAHPMLPPHDLNEGGDSRGYGHYFNANHGYDLHDDS